jgi:uncharacterized protein YdiU (UPF0061 family)
MRLKENPAMNSLSGSAPVFDSGMNWSNRFYTLGENFFQIVPACGLPAPYWVVRSERLGKELGMPGDWGSSQHWLEALSGNLNISCTTPLASVYSGHQFGVWAGQLGDGRALLLGETAGQEIQLKGAGLTPFSRMGDGRAVLRSSIREFLACEAMHALGIPTTRALCVTGSDYPVLREQLETAAVLTRTAPSFIRFGHFEHFSHNGQYEELKELADYVIDHFYPECRQAAQSHTNPYVSLLAAVSQRTAELLARWQAAGFCHGVMNTDNMSIVGVTLDYGPFQFMDRFRVGHICNHSDSQGRYAFGNQPAIAHWNLYCLAQALMPLLQSKEAAIAVLQTYPTDFAIALDRLMAAKLGLSGPQPQQPAMVASLLKLLEDNSVDYNIFWRRLSHWSVHQQLADNSVSELFEQKDAIHAWLAEYANLLKLAATSQSVQDMLRVNPKYVLRNHLGQSAIELAQRQDFSMVGQLLRVLEAPFDEHLDLDAFADFAPQWASSISISCSS